MNPYLIFVLAVLILHYLLDMLADILDVRSSRQEPPTEFDGFYDTEKYAKARNYLREQTRLGIVDETVHIAITILFILVGGFNLVDRLARAPGWGEVGTGLIFAGILMIAGRLLALPGDIYGTFVIEQKYGFNKTTRATFVADFFKSLGLGALLGGAVLALIVWLFLRTGPGAWVYCWIAVMIFQLAVIFAAPYLILPIFNKFTPLEEGELRDAIENYAASQRFTMKGVFKMDGSRRSSKSNAFFTGLGRSRRIVLLDTIVDKHPVSELVAVIAHEMGHYKLKHIPLAIVRSWALSGLLLFLMSRFIRHEGLFAAFHMDQLSVYASLVFFGFLFTPIATVISILEHYLSRRHEYEADEFSVRTTGDPEAMIASLKRLVVDNLSTLTPHPLKVFLGYSHPPIVERIAAIRGTATDNTAGQDT